jgi:hypothetical protein
MTGAKSILVWSGLAVLMILNGIVRGAWYEGITGEAAGHVISTISACLISGIFVWAVTAKYPFRSTSNALSTGFLWLGMTVVFEFAFGHYIMKHPWSRLLHDYDIPAGRVWPVFLVWLVVMPALVHRMRGRSPSGA